MWNFKQSLRSGPQMLAWILYYKNMLSYVLIWGNFSKFFFIIIAGECRAECFCFGKEATKPCVKITAEVVGDLQLWQVKHMDFEDFEDIEYSLKNQWLFTLWKVW